MIAEQLLPRRKLRRAAVDGADVACFDRLHEGESQQEGGQRPHALSCSDVLGGPFLPMVIAEFAPLKVA